VKAEEIEALEVEARKAEAKAAKAREALERQRAEARRRYEARLEEWDRKWFDAFDRDKLDAAVDEARRAFDRAVAEGTGVHAAWLNFQRAGLRRYRLVDEARTVGERVRPGTRDSTPLSLTVTDDFADAYKQAVSRVANNLVEDELDEMREEREQFASEEK
jgi:hypothetical protein